MSETTPPLSELPEEQRSEIARAEAVLLHSEPGSPATWRLSLYSTASTHPLATEDFVFAGEFFEEGVDLVSGLLGSAGLVYLPPFQSDPDGTRHVAMTMPRD